jgi:hypothetical protein
MGANEDEMRQELVELNQRIAEMEQRRDMDALEFFNRYLADQLVLRRANGVVMGKYGQQGFMRSLTAPSRFSGVRTEDIAVDLLGTRALVTLDVVATSRLDGSMRRYCNIRMFSRSPGAWLLEFWYDYEIAMPEPVGGTARLS